MTVQGTPYGANSLFSSNGSSGRPLTEYVYTHPFMFNFLGKSNKGGISARGRKEA